MININRTGTTYTATFTGTGASFAGSDTITVLGTAVGGLTPANDVTIAVDTVTAGAIATYTVTGTAVNTQTFTNVNKSNRTPSGLSMNVTLNSGTYTLAVANGGSGHAPDQVFKILGTSVFGSSPTNDLTFTIAGIDAVSTGSVTSVSGATGTANTGTGNALNVAGTNRTPIGV